MELRQLRYFVTVAHKRHFTRAAEELCIAQPALSQQIQALEHECGVALFERTSRRVQLTAAGEALLAHAEHILAAVEQTRVELQAFAELKKGRVAIGVLQSLSMYRLPALLSRFHARYPGIEITLREEVTEYLLDQIVKGQLDLALVHTVGNAFPSHKTDPQIITRPILTEEIVVIVSPHHPLAHRQTIAPQELQHESFILFKPGSGLRQALMHLGEMGGFTPHVPFESGDIGTTRALVAEGLGIAVLPRSVAEIPDQAIAAIMLNPPPPPRKVIAAWHQRLSHSPAATTFLQFLHDDIVLHPWDSKEHSLTDIPE
jgi:LysR family transcriptional activator of glutamate synthase operon